MMLRIPVIFSPGKPVNRPGNIKIYCLLTIFLLTTLADCITGFSPRLFTSSFTYELDVHTSEPITNMTLFIPIPMKNGQPMIGARALSDSDFEQDDIIPSIVCSPEGLNLSEAFPFPNNTPCFVKLVADRLQPGPTPSSGYTIHLTDYRTLSSPLLFSNTLAPVGNESVLLPKFGFNSVSPAVKEDRVETSIRYNRVDIPYKTIMYADYSASPTAEVGIGSHVEGLNEWVEGSDAWKSNSYSDYIMWSCNGESHGWQAISGTLYEGGGIHPNLTSPGWQNVIQEN